MSRKQRFVPDTFCREPPIFEETKENGMALPHPSADQLDLATILGVLGDPTRLGIVAYLARNENNPLSCGQFLDLGSKTNISYHLAKLREAGVTQTEAVGTSRLISLRRADLDRRFPGLLDSILASARELPLFEPANLNPVS
jgi:DNA-binding transcriptional ArsR family regulator